MAAIVYVDDSNTDGPWNGSVLHPYQYIGDGIDNASSGDTVFVFKGAYSENLQGVVVDRAITLIGERRVGTSIVYGLRVDTDSAYVAGFSVSMYIPSTTFGIAVGGSFNTIRNCKIYGVVLGIPVSGNSNHIYHNNFINNGPFGHAEDSGTDNIWDNGYPSGGNYWDDFDEPSEGAYDDYHGENQDQEGDDGIVDLGPPIGGLNPYDNFWGNGSQDMYPLIAPYTYSGSFIRADANADGTITMTDAIHTLRYIYVPGSPPLFCLDAVDSDDDGTIAMSDAIFTLKYLYAPGAQDPPPPFPGCGHDPTQDELDCNAHPCIPHAWSEKKTGPIH